MSTFRFYSFIVFPRDFLLSVEFIFKTYFLLLSNVRPGPNNLNVNLKDEVSQLRKLDQVTFGNS